MPGTDDRTPADASRAPASRVGQKLQEKADDPTVSAADASAVEHEAIEEAEQEGWDQRQTESERQPPS